MPDNYYDPETGHWVTSETRYEDIATQTKYAHLNELIYSDPERAWTLLLELVSEMPEDLLGFVGAGPVETFIWQHGAAFVSRIEAEAQTNPHFRTAAFEVNLAEGELPEDVTTRIVAAIGDKFRLLPPR